MASSEISLTTSPLARVFLTQYGYTYVPGLSDWFTFRVKACHDDVGVLLYSDTNNNDVNAFWNYRVILGGWENTQSELISRDKKHIATYFKTSITSCTEWRSFWVSWKNGDLAVGKGQVLFDDQIMKLEQPTYLFDIRSIGVYTTGTGQWKIPNPG
ncbi:hypothetical protein KP79_PYT25748 [Mizuhopecten yessoensis]|uniref:Farnesoic acid O-methyl transferase domain-containing protein n=1 Tax=Mizuhopecten yessoensis TaxID=6573 RepID=A0A210QLH0_MIZYE|nr:hypothetical protein KP79_PYT25748 [Mizuhopecten yessoensis]